MSLQVLQLERKGYFVVDQPYLPPGCGLKGAGRPMVLFAIPDGRSKSTAVKAPAPAAK